MNTVIVTNLKPNDAIELKYELENAGLIHKQDFSWTYQPVKYDDGWSAEPIYGSQVAFEFTNPTLASYYRIKWAK